MGLGDRHRAPPWEGRRGCLIQELAGARYLVTNPNKIPKYPWPAVVAATIAAQKLPDAGASLSSPAILSLPRTVPVVGRRTAGEHHSPTSSVRVQCRCHEATCGGG